MARLTIVGLLLDWWKKNGDISFSDAKGMYCKFAYDLRGYSPNEDYVGIGLTRILKKNGHKLGPAGSKALWRFGKEKKKMDETKVEEKREPTMMDLMREMVREIVREEVSRALADVAPQSISEERVLELIRDEVEVTVEDAVENYDFHCAVTNALDDLDMSDYIDLDEVVERCDVETKVEDALSSMSPNCDIVQETVKRALIAALQG